MREIKKEEVQVGDYAYVKKDKSRYNGYIAEILDIDSRYNEYSGEEYKIIRCDDGHVYRLSDGICISDPRVVYKFGRKSEEDVVNEIECVDLLVKQEDYYNSLGKKIVDKIKEIIKAEILDVSDKDIRIGFCTGYESLHLNVLLTKSPFSDRVIELRKQIDMI